MNTAAPRLAALFTAAVLGAGLLAGCSSDNVSCGLDQCTVTIDRTVNASADVLGVEAKFLSADQNTVTMEIAGEQIQLTKGQQAVEVAGLQVTLDSITADNIGIQVSR
jgi:outer membrane murein-binding lipoprotein Lpp